MCAGVAQRTAGHPTALAFALRSEPEMWTLSKSRDYICRKCAYAVLVEAKRKMKKANQSISSRRRCLVHMRFPLSSQILDVLREGKPSVPQRNKQDEIRGGDNLAQERGLPGGVHVDMMSVCNNFMPNCCCPRPHLRHSSAYERSKEKIEKTPFPS